MSVVESTLARQLAETVGPEHVLEEPAACAAYAVQGVTPGLVVAPGSVEELAQVLAASYAAGAAVLPWGGGTRQGLGQAPARADLVLRTARLSQVVEYEPDDLTISVQAGMTMAALRDTLAPSGQMLPVDVALPGRSTLGGALATAADGPRRLGYGSFRDLLIGIQVVEATGRVSKAGGMVVKNVSGFDLMKLYLGSLGTLAVIASANFKLLPRPRAAATILCAFESRAAAMRLADALHASQLTPVAAEYIAGYQIAATDGGWSIAGAAPASVPSYLAVWAEGLPAAVERHRRDVAALAREAGAASVEPVEGGAHDALWVAIADLTQAADIAPGELALRLTCLPSQLVRALDDVSATARRNSMRAHVVARALSGVAYLRVSAAESAKAHAFQRELLSRWPSLVVLGCDAALKTQLAVWGGINPGRELMQRIRHEFDPQGTLNPGRFVV